MARDIQTITLRELLPPSIASDPDILAAADAVDAELHITTGFIPNVAIIHNLRNGWITDPTLIDLLAAQYHVDFYDPALPIDIRRTLVAKSLDWHTRKGTISAVEEVVSTIFPGATIREWYEYAGLPYRFKVVVDIAYLDEDDEIDLLGYGDSGYSDTGYGDEIDIIGSDSIFLKRVNQLIDAVYTTQNTRSKLETIEIVRDGRHDADTVLFNYRGINIMMYL